MKMIFRVNFGNDSVSGSYSFCYRESSALSRTRKLWSGNSSRFQGNRSITTDTGFSACRSGVFIQDRVSGSKCWIRNI